MDTDKIAKIKESLFSEKAKLEKDLSSFTRKDTIIKDNYKAEFPDFGNDDDENANEVAEYADRLGLEHTLEKQLRDVNKALKNIDTDKYGVCNHCGNDIEEGRLEVRPTSTSCVACKKRLQGEDS